jgi:ABC-type microcin C transport system permease subunit YejB
MRTPPVNSKYRGAQGLDPEFVKSLEKQFGFDKPAPERFALMCGISRGSISARAIFAMSACCN